MESNYSEEQLELSWVKNVDLEYLRKNKDKLIWGLILEFNKLKEEWLEEIGPRYKILWFHLL